LIGNFNINGISGYADKILNMGIEDINLKKTLFVKNEFQVESGSVLPQFNQLTTVWGWVVVGIMDFLLLLFPTGEEKK